MARRRHPMAAATCRPFYAVLIALFCLGLPVCVPYALADADAGARQHNAATDEQNIVSPVSPTDKYLSGLLSSASCASKDANSCPFYGCVLLPRDINYDTKAKAALDTLRGVAGKGGNPAAGVDTSTGTSDEQDIAKALDELRLAGGGSDNNAGTLTLIGYKGGRVEDQINQDRAFVVSPFRVPAVADLNNDDMCIDKNIRHKEGEKAQLLGVFDGHDTLGEKVSEYATQQVPRLVASKLAEMAEREIDDGGWTDDVRIQETKTILSDTFIEVDANGLKELGISSGGCTATVVLRLDDMLYAANAGDSRSIIATYTKTTGKVAVVYATREDKPELPDEMQRVEQSGGKIYFPEDKRESSRVYYLDSAGQFRGGLAMSRSLGDWDLGSKGVIPDPIVDALSISDIISQAINDSEKDSCRNDEDSTENQEEGTCSATRASSDDVRIFAISATDGVLDYLQPIEIAQEIASSLFGGNEQSKSPRAKSSKMHLFAAQTNVMLFSAQGWHGEFKGEYRDDMAIAAALVIG